MYKANLEVILFFVFLLMSCMIFYIFFFKNKDSEFLEISSYSYRGIKLTPENAPPLKSLFDNLDKDPHKNFISASECLKCHISGMEIKGKFKAPQIVHNIKDYCISCHQLAKNE